MNYYRHYLGDYQRDTAHLSLAEHGAYRLLLDAYYASDGPLPADERSLFRVARAMDEDEREAVRRVVREFFVLTDEGTLANARCEAELAIGLAAIQTARENGKRGGRPQKRNLAETQRDTQRVSQREPSGVPSGKAPQPPTPNLHPPSASRQPQKPNGAAAAYTPRLAEHFENPDHRAAYLAAVSGPSFDGMLRTLHAPITGGGSAPWDVIGQALLECGANEAKPTASAVRAYVGRLIRAEAMAQAAPVLTVGGLPASARDQRNAAAIAAFLKGDTARVFD